MNYRKLIILKEREIKEMRQDLRNGVDDFEKCVKECNDIENIFDRAKEFAIYDIRRDEKVKVDGKAEFLWNYWRDEPLLHKQEQKEGAQALQNYKDNLNKLP